MFASDFVEENQWIEGACPTYYPLDRDGHIIVDKFKEQKCPSCQVGHLRSIYITHHLK
jgi:hypothetical protein